MGGGRGMRFPSNTLQKHKIRFDAIKLSKVFLQVLVFATKTSQIASLIIFVSLLSLSFVQPLILTTGQSWLPLNYNFIAGQRWQTGSLRKGGGEAGRGQRRQGGERMDAGVDVRFVCFVCVFF